MICSGGLYQRAAEGRSNIARILKTAAFLCSEYPQYVPKKAELIQHLLRRRMAACDPDVQTAAVQAVLKLYAHLADPPGDEGEEDKDASTASDALSYIFPQSGVGSPSGSPSKSQDEDQDGGDDEERGIDVFLSSCDVDVQEHATTVKHLIRAHANLVQEDGSEAGEGFRTLCGDMLKPVAPGAQEQVAPPAELSLDEQIIDYQLPSSDEDFDDSEPDIKKHGSSDSSSEGGRRRRKKESKSDGRRKKQNDDYHHSDPHYLVGGGEDNDKSSDDDNDVPPIQELPGNLAAELSGINLGIGGYKAKRDRKGKREFDTEFEAPEGYASPGASKKKEKAEKKEKKEEKDDEEDNNDVWAALDVDLSGPTGELPTVKPYERKSAADFDSKKDRDRRRRRRRRDSDDEEEEEERRRDEKKDKKDRDRRRRRRDEDEAQEPEPAVDLESAEAKKLRKRLKKWLSDVPIGGKEGSSSKRKFDVVPITEFALKKRMADADPEAIYEAFVESKGEHAEAPSGSAPPASSKRSSDKKEKKAKKEGKEGKEAPVQERKEGSKASAPVNGESFVSAVPQWEDATRSGGAVVVQLSLRLKNVTQASLRDVEISVPASDKTGTVLGCGSGWRVSKGSVQPSESLKVGAGEEVTVPLKLDISADTFAPVALVLRVRATSKTGEKRMSLPLTVPVSASLQPVKGQGIDADGFAEVVKRMTKDGGVASARCEVAVDDIGSAFGVVTDRLRLSKVEVFEECASLHGVHLGPQGSTDICGLAKAIRDDLLRLEFKCASQPLAKSLSDEAAQIFQK
eukprot:Hpha_TRINITY_DN15407_c0_g2::TRINITY_DN15407_c0_g2_i1::g.172974::m.172974/K12396/AP3D; AP-3 complex subunit delta